MKKSFILPKFYLILVALTIFSSCRKNILDTTFSPASDNSNNGLSITEAKLWFEQNSSVSRRTTSDVQSFKIKNLFWNRATNAEDNNFYVVELPLQLDKSIALTFSGVIDKKSIDVVRLLILKDKKSGSMRSALMHIVSNTGEADTSNTYSERNKRFSGFIFFTNSNVVL